MSKRQPVSAPGDGSRLEAVLKAGVEHRRLQSEATGEKSFDDPTEQVYLRLNTIADELEGEIQTLGFILGTKYKKTGLPPCPPTTALEALLVVQRLQDDMLPRIEDLKQFVKKMDGCARGFGDNSDL